MKQVLVGLILTWLVASPACASFVQAKKAPGRGPAVFGGMRLTGSLTALALGWKSLPKGTSMSCGAPLLPFLLPDLPFSLAADVVLLPVSIVNELLEGGIDVFPLAKE